jgi:hypothetical protein
MRDPGYQGFGDQFGNRFAIIDAFRLFRDRAEQFGQFDGLLVLFV